MNVFEERRKSKSFYFFFVHSSVATAELERVVAFPDVFRSWLVDTEDLDVEDTDEEDFLPRIEETSEPSNEVEEEEEVEDEEGEEEEGGVREP